jgi:hypothetical protein
VLLQDLLISLTSKPGKSWARILITPEVPLIVDLLALAALISLITD